MNALIVFSAVLAVALANPDTQVSVSRGALGDYDVKYATDTMSRSEHRNIFGEVNGGYSYVDPTGLLRKVEYTADENGFRAIGSGIPLPVETPEVTIARAENIVLPLHVRQTPEVAIARSENIVLPLHVRETPEVAIARSENIVLPLHVRETPEVAIARSENIVLPVRETPEVALARSKNFVLLRNAELSPFRKVVEAPIATPLEISSAPLVRSSYVDSVQYPYVNTPLVRVAAPEAHQILELETKPWAAHIGRREHFLI